MAKPEYFDGTGWQTCSGDGADISVQNEPGTPIPITGSLTISAGLVNMTLGAELDALSAFSQNGLMARTGTGSYVGRSLVAGTGINITNGNGVLGNPVISATGLLLTLTGAVTGSGNGTINTTLGENQSLPFSYLKHNWSSGVEKGVYHTLVDAATPPHFVHKVEVGSGSTYRRWLTVYQPGFGSSRSGKYELGFYHSNGGHEYPFTIQTYGSSLRTYIRTTIDINNNQIINALDPVSSQDVATKSYVDSVAGGTPLASNGINVNTNGGLDHWLRRSNTTITGTTIYNQNSNSFIFEDKRGESAGLAVNGDSDGCTIWSPGDSGAYLNIQDEDSSNTRAAYVNTSGAWTVVSSETRKHSVKDKINNNVLDRFLRLSVKSYGYKQEKRKNSSKLREARIEKKANKMHIGLILEELFEVFPNCIPDYYNSLFQNKGSKKNLNLKEEIKDISNSGINYNVLLCYFIMAFQEYAKKTNNEISFLKNIIKGE